MQQLLTRVCSQLDDKAMLLSCREDRGAHRSADSHAYLFLTVQINVVLDLRPYNVKNLLNLLNHLVQRPLQVEVSWIELAIQHCFIMPGIPLQQEQEAIAFLQKTPSADGGSFYDHVTDVVMKVPDVLHERAYILSR